MPSAPDTTWSLSCFPSIPSAEDITSLNEKVESGSKEALSILDKALAEFDEAVSKIGRPSRN